MTGAIQGIEHRERIKAALIFAAYADSAVHQLSGHAFAQMFTLAAHIADRHGDLDEDALAGELVRAGWHQHEHVPATRTQQLLQVIGSGIAWWQAVRTHGDDQAGHDGDAADAAVRATAAGLVPGAAMGGIAQLARRSSLITHCHPDARDAAAIQACATALACTEPSGEHIDVDKYIGVLSAQCRTKLMTDQLAVVGRLVCDGANPDQARAEIGDKATAPAAVAVALTGFLCHPGRPSAVVEWVQAMGLQWHASAVMGAVLAAAAYPHARPPITWRAGAGQLTEIEAIANALASSADPPERRRLKRAG